jgi:hypothetical protein
MKRGRRSVQLKGPHDDSTHSPAKNQLLISETENDADDDSNDDADSEAIIKLAIKSLKSMKGPKRDKLAKQLRK